MKPLEKMEPQPPHPSVGTKWLDELKLHWTELADTRFLPPNSTDLTSDELLKAIIADDLDTLMEFCVNNGLPVESRVYITRLLPCACSHGCLRVSTLLVARGADVNGVDGDDLTPLACAASSGNLGLVSLLVQKAKLDSNLEASQQALAYINDSALGAYALGSTALQVAAERGHADIVAFLVREGADVWVRDALKRTPLFNACLRCPTAVWVILGAVNPAELSEYVNIADVLGITALHYVAMSGSTTSALQALVAAGASVTTRDTTGSTPLIGAAKRGELKFLKYLIENVEGRLKYDCVNARDGEGKTALHWAVLKGHHDSRKLLIDQGASVFIPDNNGKSPFGYVGVGSVGALLLRWFWRWFYNGY